MYCPSGQPGIPEAHLLLMARSAPSRQPEAHLNGVVWFTSLQGHRTYTGVLGFYTAY